MLSCRTGLLTEACEHRKGTVEVFLARIVLAGGKGQRSMGGEAGDQPSQGLEPALTAWQRETMESVRLFAHKLAILPHS